jgi:hypothetical protein
MKRKQIEKKLGLNKMTVTNLSRLGMEQVKGGVMLMCTDACTDGCDESNHFTNCTTDYPGTSVG